MRKFILLRYFFNCFGHNFLNEDFFTRTGGIAPAADISGLY
jgi:hypothetical protein